MLRVIVRTVLLLSAAAPLARADMGLKPPGRVRVTVTYEREPLLDGRFDAALLSPAPTEGLLNMARVVPGLEDLLAEGRWGYAPYLWGGDGRDGQVTFTGFEMTGGIPERVRLAVYLPSQERLFLTSASETTPYTSALRADLRADGTGTLELVRVPLWHQRRFPFALGMTLLVESAIVVVYGRRRDPRPAGLPRLLLACLVVNLLSLPLVWFVTLEGYWQYGWRLGIVCFALAELGAAVFEGFVYARLGRLGVKTGMGLSIVANAASMAIGILM